VSGAAQAVGLPNVSVSSDGNLTRLGDTCEAGAGDRPIGSPPTSKSRSATSASGS